MKQEGHLGFSLLINSPIIATFVFYDLIFISLLYTICIVSLSSFPDVDIKIEKSRINKLFGIEHRGFTHTLLFCLIIGLIFSIVFYFISDQLIIGYIAGYIAGFMSIFSHILGDLFTPTGVNVSPMIIDRTHTISLFNYNNFIANIGLMIVGSFSIILSYNIYYSSLSYYIVHYSVLLFLSVVIIMIASKIPWKYYGRIKIIRKLIL